MKFDQLTYFIEAARLEHIGHAAKSLNISPSAISHSIAQLEEELGRELFLKKGKRIVLTVHGRLLMERSKKLIDELDCMREELQSDKIPLRGNHKMAGSHDLCSSFLVPAWSELQCENPQMTGEIFAVRSAQVIAGILSGEFDFGLCFNPVDHPELQSKVLRTGTIVIAVQKKHPVLKLKGVEQFKALSEYSAALPKSFQGIDVCERHPMFEKFGIKVRPRFLFDSYAVSLTHVQNTQTWTFVPEWLAEDRKGNIEILKPPTGWSAPYHIAAVWAKARGSLAAVEKLVEKVRKLV